MVLSEEEEDPLSEELTSEELRRRCQQAKVNHVGTKSQMVGRLQTHFFWSVSRSTHAPESPHTP